MVTHDLIGRGVEDPDVLAAMASVPRERFVPDSLAHQAYEDRPLPIGDGQTISQPYVVALMAQAAEIGPGDRVLEIGAGSGYGAAVLGRLAGEVWAVERHAGLAARASRVLADLGVDNVHVVVGDGTLGLADAAPFDAVVVTACGPQVPEALLDQLADQGRLVMPVGAELGDQELVRLRRSGGRFRTERLGAVRFVPLVGAQGFAPDQPPR